MHTHIDTGTDSLEYYPGNFPPYEIIPESWEYLEDFFTLTVQGNEFQDVGLIHRDLLLVERTSDIADGNVVIAEDDEKYCLKKYLLKNNQIYLSPLNATNQESPLHPAQNFTIRGKVRGVIRNLG